MQGILTRRVFSRKISLCSQRCFSQLAQKTASLQENDVTVPKMPPFDYSPPPYNGPTVDEIMAKRKAYLSPSLYHLYKKPVSHSPTPDHFSSSSSSFSLSLISEKSCISLFHFLKTRVSIYWKKILWSNKDSVNLDSCGFQLSQPINSPINMFPYLLELSR